MVSSLSIRWEKDLGEVRENSPTRHQCALRREPKIKTRREAVWIKWRMNTMAQGGFDAEKLVKMATQDLQRAAAIRTVKDELYQLGETVVKVSGEGLPPRLRSGDMAHVKKFAINKYAPSDIVLFELSGGLRFGRIRKISVSSAGINIAVILPNKTKEIIGQNSLFGRVVSIDRDLRSIPIHNGLIGKIQELFSSGG